MFKMIRTTQYFRTILQSSPVLRTVRGVALAITSPPSEEHGLKRCGDEQGMGHEVSFGTEISTSFEHDRISLESAAMYGILRFTRSSAGSSPLRLVGFSSIFSAIATSSIAVNGLPLIFFPGSSCPSSRA